MMNNRLDDIVLTRLLANPDFLLDEIDRNLEAVPFENLPSSVLSGDDTDGIGEQRPYREVRDGRPRHAVLDVMLEKVASPLREVICVKGRYCEMSEKHGATLDVVKAVADSILSLSVTIPLPVATVAAYCVQSLFLNRLCKCNA